MCLDEFGEKRSHFRFRFATKTLSSEEQEELTEDVINTEMILKLSGLTVDGFMTKGWKIQPLHIPPVVCEYYHIILNVYL